MDIKLKKGYRLLVIDDEPGNLVVTTRLSKKQFQEKLKNNRLTFGRMHSQATHITKFNSSVEW